jgi:hypothetical protein
VRRVCSFVYSRALGSVLLFNATLRFTSVHDPMMVLIRAHAYGREGKRESAIKDIFGPC